MWRFIKNIIFYIKRVFKIENKYQYLLEHPKRYDWDTTMIENIYYTSSPLIQCLDEFCQQENIYKKGAIVSLSGGVDSMVLLTILLYLQKKYKFPIYTATIDYGLRKESKEEVCFLKEYTKLFSIESYVSCVEGISRKQQGSKSRSEFEKESRNIRFQTYEKIMKEKDIEGVFLAHHQDDLLENIFTNSMRGGNLLDLEVMKPVQEIHHIKIFRPFLQYKKQVIYDFAHRYGIPYFLDTTPKWSNRGKMRNEIFPLLDSVFGNQWRLNLKHLGFQSNEWGTFIEHFVIQTWMDQIVFGSCGFILPIRSYSSKLIYENIIMKSLHKIGQCMIKKTSMDKIMDLLAKRHSKLIVLDQFRYAYIDENDFILFNAKQWKKEKGTDLFHERLYQKKEIHFLI